MGKTNTNPTISAIKRYLYLRQQGPDVDDQYGQCNSMNSLINKAIHYGKKKPGVLFLVDSIGAAATACFILFAFILLSDYAGMPKHALWYLFAIALVYCMYSAACYLLLQHNHSKFLKIIGIANLFYCGVTWVCIITYFNQLTAAGLAYFLLETMVIAVLAGIELRVAIQLK